MSYADRMAVMKSSEKPTQKRLSEQEIDEIVESQADDDSAWEKPFQVRRKNQEMPCEDADFSRRPRPLP